MLCLMDVSRRGLYSRSVADALSGSGSVVSSVLSSGEAIAASCTAFRVGVIVMTRSYELCMLCHCGHTLLIAIPCLTGWNS